MLSISAHRSTSNDVPTTLAPGEITFAPPLAFDTTYPATSDYYWGTISSNMTSVSDAGVVTAINGPLGFGSAVALDGQSCLSQSRWSRPLDACADNPAQCRDGLSFSLWTRLNLPQAGVLFGSDSTRVHYLLSTGGDAQGHPGVGVFLRGHELTALVSTGRHYWISSVHGHLTNQSWINIGVRWRRDLASNTSDGDFQGLQLFINQQLVSWTALPQLSTAATAKQPLQPAEIMLGCHRTSSQREYQHMCACDFDEAAMWVRAIHETLFFLGGFDASDSQMTAESLLDQLLNCRQCSQNPQQFQAVVAKVLKLTNTAPQSPPPTTTAAAAVSDNYDATTQSTGLDDTPVTALPPDIEVADEDSVRQLKSLANLLVVMTENVKSDMQHSELPLFLDITNIVSKMLQPDNLPKWRGLEFGEKENAGSAQMVGRFERWVISSTASVRLEKASDQVSVVKTKDNMMLEVMKHKAFSLRQQPVVTLPSGAQQQLNVVQVASELFRGDNSDVNGGETGCAFADVSVLFARYDTYGVISPRRVSSVGFTTSDAQLLQVDGPVLSVKVQITAPYTATSTAASAVDNTTTSSDNTAQATPAPIDCRPSQQQLRLFPVVALLSHSHKLPALRRALFHDENQPQEVLRRSCVWWNDELSDYGGWDATGCSAVESNAYYTKCACHTFGQYAVMIEKIPAKVVETEHAWLKIVKYVCYSLSIVLLLVFIGTVCCFKQLHEMFHLIRLNTAVALLLGALFMCASDLSAVRHDRHTCVAIAALIHFCYLLAAGGVVMEAVADFLSVTNGAIGGKLRSYVAFAWSIPLVSLGYAMLYDLDRYGTDPRCMVSYDDDVMWTMFAPMAACMVVALVSAAVIACNLQSPWLRKESIVAEQTSVCRGLTLFAPYFALTWLVAMLAYLHAAPRVPGLYSLFQVLNSTVGVMFFVLCGIGSDRFRLLMAGQARLRALLQLKLTVQEQLGDDKQLHQLLPTAADATAAAASGKPGVENDDDEAQRFDPISGRCRRPMVA